MRHRSLTPGLVLLFALGSILTGCASDECDVHVQPLTGFCQQYVCSTYDEAVARVQATGRSGGCLLGEAGTCGTLRYITFSHGFGGYHAYFDAAGTLVAAETFSDAIGVAECGRIPDPVYGQLQNCTRVAASSLCGRP